MTRDRCFVEQRGRVAQRTGHRVAIVNQIEFEIELRAIECACNRGDFQVRPFDRPHVGVLPRNHHLEDRRMTEPSRRLHDFHDLFEREILVILCGDDGSLDAVEQLRDRRYARQVDAQRKRVHEQAHDGFELGTGTIRDRGADHDILLAGETPQHRGPGRGDDREDRDAAPRGEPSQIPREHRVEFERQPRRVELLMRGPRAIGRQRQQRRDSRQRFFPETCFAFETFRAQPLPLPCHVVGVLERQRGKRVRASCREGPVKRAQVLDEHGQRPAVADDVVQREHEDVRVLRQPDEARTHERPACEVERARGFFLAQAQCVFRRPRFRRQIVYAPRHAVASRKQRRAGIAACTCRFGKHGAQRLVARPQRIQRAMPCVGVQPAIEPQHERDVIDRARAFESAQEHHSLLRERQRQRGVAIDAGDRRRIVPVSGADRLRDRTHGRMIEQRRQRQPDLVHGPQAIQHPHGKQRMAAERKEVVVAADAFDAEQFGPQRGDGALDLALRRFVLRLGEGVVVRLRQCATVELAVRRERQRVEHDECRRHHVVGQPCGKVIAQVPDAFCMLCTWRRVVQHHVRQQSGVARCIGTRQHDGFAYGVVQRKLRFDFAEFDTEAPDLDLIVVAAKEDDVAVRLVTRQIAGAVHACFRLAGRAGERVGQEPLRGQLRTVEIATRDPDPADVQLADGAQRHRRLRLVEQIDARIGDRLADRHGWRIEICRTREGGHIDGRFSRTIQVVQLRMRQTLQAAPRGCRRQRLAAADDARERRTACEAGRFEETAEHRRHEVQGGDAVLRDDVGEIVRITMRAGRSHDERGAIGQRPEEFPDRHVEAERCLLQHDIAGIQAIGRLHPGQAVDQRIVLVLHALWQTGGARRVDHVGEMTRGQAECVRRQIMRRQAVPRR
ncbi:hypothetical protein BLA6992_00002 [Burkholderia lata]|nr:hypothetical protein BLA6992_00002 [Burkholderia lata]